MAERALNWRRYIAINPKITGGKPVIKGTRVPIQVIVGSLAGGMSIEEVCEQYRLTPKQVQAALAYAAQVLTEERVYALAR